MGQPLRDTPQFTSQWAFVVQFRVDTVVEDDHYVGRVEHIRSGRVEQFESLDGLLGFIKQVLCTIADNPPEAWM